MKTSVWLLLVSAAVLAAGNGYAEVNIEETIVGPANAGGVYAVSPHGAHVGYAATRGSRLVVTVDGVEGPVFDELFEPRGGSFFSPQRVSILPASSGGQNASTVTPVIFSADGAHYAYAGRQGIEYVVIHDGKEIARGPRQMLALQYGALTLSPGGRHVYWDEMQTQGARGSWRLMMSGKPGPWSGHQTMAPVFSPDESHYAYNAGKVDDYQQQMLIVDGKDAGYVGLQPVFTADGKRLLTISPVSVASPKPSLLVNGKPVVTGTGIGKVVPAPVGSGYAVIATSKREGLTGANALYIDGKEVPGTEGVQNVWFSPDGKHYAATCVNAAARSCFMVVDGKKGNEYQGITDKQVYWTPDSSKLIYMATSAGRSFLIVDGKEIPVEYLQGLMRAPIQMAEQGNHYAFATFDGANRNFTVIVNGNSVLPASFYPVGDTLSFSADGSRYAYLVGPVGRSETTGLVVDGTLLEGLVPVGFAKRAAMEMGTNAYLFSPDGKQVACVASGTSPNSTGLYVNGKLVYPGRGIGLPAFTPDSRHLVWTAHEKFPDRPQPYLVVYVDGKEAVRLSENDFFNTKGSWEMGEDGVLTFLTTAGDEVKRYRITPSPDTNVERMAADAEAGRARALAEAEAAKKKAAEDAAAAKAKLEADKAASAAKAKADYEAAVAKKKADYEAAVAAKNKARADALAAKAEARRIQLENARRAKQGLPPLP